MKRMFLVVALFLSIIQLHAQDTAAVAPKPTQSSNNKGDYEYDKFNFGLAITPSINWLTPANDLTEKDGVKVGFSYGIVGEISFAERYAFSTGVDIAYHGGKLTYELADSLGGTISDNYKLNYANIPISVKMRTNKFSPKSAFFGQFGAVIGINTGAKAERSYSNGQENETVSLGKQATDVIVGLRVGLGMEYFLSGDTRAFAGLTWNQGFTKVLQDDFDSKSNYIALQLGVFF